MRNLSKLTFRFLTPLAMILAMAGEAGAQDGKTARIALGDIASIESLNLLVALENAKARGVDIELTAFKSEDIANQAVVNGQADIGIGTPYAVIQKVNAPIRIFYQLSELSFFPVVAKEIESWQDLDGEDFVVHARASGTEAMANLMAQKEGIEFNRISYVPGSEVRALALLEGNIKATFLDIANKNFVMGEAPGEFNILSVPEDTASDEALFARTDWLDENPETVQILLEELLKVWKKTNEDPGFIAAERERLNLLSDLPEELESEIQPYFEQAVEAGMFPSNGGSEAAARADFDFYVAAGQLEGPAEELEVEDFWYLDPLEQAQAAIGG